MLLEEWDMLGGRVRVVLLLLAGTCLSAARAEGGSAFTIPILSATEPLLSAAGPDSMPSPQPDSAAVPSLHAPADAGIARSDRLQHLSLAFASGLALGIATEEPLAAAAGALGLGLLKELLDARQGGGADALDLAADALGAGLALLATAGLAR
jgi:hypothetical protein